ncbi:MULTISPECIES: ABC transporter permease/substrate-binding protein [Sphingobium]|uniref:ABC transporter permease/substrate-binding protein n=1 Tax=Sphingobium TaxID=165695 RepID=UPI0015EC6B70|nr:MULTISPECIES: ABC transporter permease/substrate-binding protein [Sphingobium]MCW2362326.1 osmoprotectant transport system permease protein [Sphingobium sp. B10D3B]MCW2400995.1 osmoprotectant transport system permease protein [Sphingobium sp. B10D7B]MCW2407974.1 osmoprotectant transport system permease protein [Sphingobium xanthum]
MDSSLSSALRVLPEYLGFHVLLSAAALGLGILLSLPLAIAASRSARLRWPVLSFVSLVQTIPGLALMALFYPLLLALSLLSLRLTGQGFSALGFLPALLALTLYSMLPIVRNIVTGITTLDPALIEAAHGVGMTDRQRLLQVEMPLVAPVAMAGVRTAAVWVIGTATLATPVGQTSLGNYIFSGLQTENWVWVLFGCGVSAALALAVDQLLGLIETGIARRARRRIWAGALILCLGIATAAASVFAPATRGGYVIGAKNFTEQYILADLIGQRLADEGGTATVRSGLGSAVVFRALAQGDVDVYVDYSGTVWANVMGRTDQPGRAAMLAQMAEWLKREHGVTLVGPLGFENAYALAMRADKAQQLGIRSIADLAPYAPRFVMGGDFEFFTRPDWTALTQGYGLRFARTREYQSTFLYRAVKDGDVDVISAFSSDGRIAADNLLVLADPLERIPPYDAIVMVAPGRETDARLMAALKPLIGAIPVEQMRAANLMVDRPDRPVAPAVAARWLMERNAGQGDQ